ncbi:MAG: cytidine/deoxycytidylate deaminase family protein [Candidatus Bathyarchaeota archaeon]|nr:MAG: cytidine/deoxycytidylate deaminase family protein [Candidatus Bathyarchaeota archaeon]
MKECKRPSWDRYFLDLCEAVSKRATCDRGRSGSVIVKDKRILATGYVGSPAQMPHCDEKGHDMRKVFDEAGTVTEHCVRTLHAEQNAIIQAAKFGVSIDGATLYCKMVPCRSCAMMIVNSGIKRVVAERHYHAEADTMSIFREVGIELAVASDEVAMYDRQ